MENNRTNRIIVLRIILILALVTASLWGWELMERKQDKEMYEEIEEKTSIEIEIKK